MAKKRISYSATASAQVVLNPTRPIEDQLPKSEIEWLVGREHVSMSDQAIRDMILGKSKHWPQEAREAAAEYAVKCHRENQELYHAVMTGRF